MRASSTREPFGSERYGAPVVLLGRRVEEAVFALERQLGRPATSHAQLGGRTAQRIKVRGAR